MTPMHNSKASIEVRELKDELREEELQTVFGGKHPSTISISRTMWTRLRPSSCRHAPHPSEQRSPGSRSDGERS